MTPKGLSTFFNYAIGVLKMSVRSYFKRTFNDWVSARQISACREMLGQHAHALGPTHRKEMEQVYARLLSEKKRHVL